MASGNATRQIARERADKAVELRLAGASYGQIARALGYSDRTNARRAVRSRMEAQQATSRGSTNAQREAAELELVRLDALLTGLWPKARRGDVQAVDRVLAIEQRRAHLLATLAERPAVTTPAENVTPLSDFRERLSSRRNERRAGEETSS